MATVSKNFRIKDGLIVEGTTGTINGNNILTTASTTSSLGEGTNLYYTNERVDDRVANLVNGGTGITVTYDDDGNALGLSADFGEFSTTDIAEGDKLFFTDERAQDAIAAALANGNHVNITVEYNDAGNAINLTGAVTYTDADAKNAIASSLGNGLQYTIDGMSGQNKFSVKTAGAGLGISMSGSALELKYGSGITTDVGDPNRIAVDTGEMSPVASKTYVSDTLGTHASDTSTHGVTGDIVGTSDTQTLSNKTFSDAVTFGNTSTIAGDVGAGGDLDVVASNNLHLTSTSGNIVLNPDGAAYITSASAGNQIATNAYVDNAVSGLAWKEAVNLFATSNVPLTGNTGTVVIDGHAALDSTDSYRLLLTNQTDATENGIYVYADNGATYTLTRALDSDDIAELIGAAVFVMEGTTYGSTSWVQSNHYANTFDDLNWTQFSGTGSVTAGTGITVNGLEVSVDRSTVDGWYDAAGSAAQALLDANDYADTNFVNVADLPGQLDDYVPLTQKAANNGVATLDATGDVPATQLGNVNTAITGQTITPAGIIISAGGYFGQSGDSGIRMHSDTNQSVITSETAVCTLQKQASKIVITAKNGSNVQVTEVLSVMDDAHNIYMTEYASVCSAATDLMTINIEYAGYGTVQYVKVTPTNPGDTTVTTNQFSIG